MGKFADVDDVTDRYEGDFPSERLAWVDTRIDDVEVDLILMVPSLGLPFDQIDSTRARRAKSLVSDKVLELFRNPERLVQHTTTFGPLSESVGYSPGGRSKPKGYFSDEEVSLLRLRARRSNLGVVRVKPWVPGGAECH